MSKKLWHPTSGALLTGCLLATTAQAQTAPITPITEPATPATTAEAPVPQRVAPPGKAVNTLGLDLQFSDITVTELLKTLGGQFGINISVDDSVDGVISYINLTNSTPLEALQTVIATRRDLSLAQMPNGNYIVSKVRPGESMAGTGASAMPNYLPGMGQAQPISPAGGTMGGMTDNSRFDLQGLGTGRNNTGSFNVPPSSFGQGVLGQSALPQFGQQAMNPLLNDLPDLVTVNGRSGKIRQKAIKIRNGSASFIAYQLDPVSNKVPIELLATQGNANAYNKTSNATNALGDGFGNDSSFNTFNQNDFAQTRTNPYLQNSALSLVRPEVRAYSQFGGNNQNNNRGGNNNNRGGVGGNNQNGGGGNFNLPDGIEQVVSVDPQNVLLVAYEEGNDEAVRQLQELIDVLDQPLRQVEIEAQFVELQSQDARTLGIDFSTSRGNFDAATTGFASAPVQGAFQIGFVRNNFSARLNALIADNRAKVITAPRVTAINNLTANLTSQERRTLILTSVAQNIGGGQQAAQQLLFIDTQTGLTVTPTINGDDTITVLMRPQVSTQDGTSGLGTITTRSLTTIANVRDGDTIALGGLKVVRNTTQNYKVPLLGDIPLLGALFRSKTITENESELIIFLSARIIRRAGDDTNVIVPGT